MVKAHDMAASGPARRGLLRLYGTTRGILGHMSVPFGPALPAGGTLRQRGLALAARAATGRDTADSDLSSVKVCCRVYCTHPFATNLCTYAQGFHEWSRFGWQLRRIWDSIWGNLGTELGQFFEAMLLLTD